MNMGINIHIFTLFALPYDNFDWSHTPMLSPLLSGFKCSFSRSSHTMYCQPRQQDQRESEKGRTGVEV